MSNKSNVSSAKKNNKKIIKPIAKKSKVKKNVVKSQKVSIPKSKNIVKTAIKKISAKKSKVKKNVVKSQKVSIPKSKNIVKASIKKASAKKVNVKKTVSKKSDQKPKIKPIVKKIIPKSKAKNTTSKTLKTKKVDLIKPKELTPKKNLITKSENKELVSKASKDNSDKKTNTQVLAINNTIPKKEVSEISLSKIESISKSITNPVKKIDSYAIKPEKEPNGRFEIEFIVHSSADLLFEFLSTASGLSEWFCDDVNIRNGIFTFIWDGQMQQARLLKTVDLLLVRFQWVDKHDGSYFEFKIQRDELTNDISLIITDFAETQSEKESSTLLWNSQIEKLMHVIGSIF